VVRLVSGPAGGILSKLPFLVTGALAAALQWVLLPVIWFFLKEPQVPHASRQETLREVGRQFRELFRSRILWSAAGLVVLVIAAPGFKTALLYYQQDVLKFSKPFIGFLELMAGLGGMVAAGFYALVCRYWNLRKIMYGSIVFHAVMTLLYLGYRTELSAMIITPLEGATLVLAVLPLYDLSARATPRGSEALGYCVMMSVWNFTVNMSDWLGSMIYRFFHTDFSYLVWTNAITTSLVLIAVPFLPAVLMDRRDGEAELRPEL
jgi:predicted MFS family arabinose efflux permease